MKIKLKKVINDYRLNAISLLKNLNYLNEDDIHDFDTKLYDAMSKFSQENNYNNIEKLYKDKFFHIYLNIDANSYLNNNYIINKLKNNEIKLSDIINMSPREIAPDKWDFYNKTEDATVKSIANGNSGTMPSTTLYTCSRCKKNDCYFSQLQTRSCDEGITNFITCKNCGKNWRQYN